MIPRGGMVAVLVFWWILLSLSLNFRDKKAEQARKSHFRAFIAFLLVANALKWGIELLILCLALLVDEKNKINPKFCALLGRHTTKTFKILNNLSCCTDLDRERFSTNVLIKRYMAYMHVHVQCMYTCSIGACLSDPHTSQLNAEFLYTCTCFCNINIP